MNNAAQQTGGPSIYLSKADIGETETAFVLDALTSGWIAPLGPHVDAFETEIANYVGTAGALALSSGTAALHLALLAAGAAPGRLVLVPTLTFAASANAVMYTGAAPVFVDSLASDGNVDPALLVSAVDTLRREGGDIAAVMTVDLFGRCAEYDLITEEMAIRGIPVIEDAAEALGARYGSKAAGSFGRVGALSFNGNKILTTSGGGMLLSDDLDLLARCRHLATQAREQAPYYEHAEIGYNYRLSNILAALGRGQLRRLDQMVSRRRQIRAMYEDGLHRIRGLHFLGATAERDDGDDNCWLTTILLDPEIVEASPATVITALAQDNIEARYLWKPMHLQPIFCDTRSFINGTSERIFNTGIALPSGSALTDEDITRTIAAVTIALAGGS